MSEQEKQGSLRASSPSVNAPAKVPAAGCDEAVREATPLCALAWPPNAPCKPGRYVSAAGTGARSPTGSCEPGTCGFAAAPITEATKETP